MQRAALFRTAFFSDEEKERLQLFITRYLS